MDEVQRREAFVMNGKVYYRDEATPEELAEWEAQCAARVAHREEYHRRTGR